MDTRPSYFLQMEETKWENLNEDCLVNVFSRLDVESLLLDVPLVCKHWYHATLNPLSWQKLVFPVDIYGSRLAAEALEGRVVHVSFVISRLIKFVVGRSQGCATTIVLPGFITKKDLIYVSDKCPSLKILALPSDSYYCDDDVDDYVDDVGPPISELIVKWKRLEVLKLYSCGCMVRIINEIGLHCENFVELSVTNARIDREVASAIVSKIAHIKRLVLDEADLEKENLELILRGCKELELLYVRDCEGFDEEDEEILMIASRIKDFRCEGSKANVYNSYVYDDDHYGWEFDCYEDYLPYSDY